MKRNSKTIWIESPNAITPLTWDNESQSPVWQGIEEPTLSVLKASYDRDKNNIIVIADSVSISVKPIREIDARRLRLALLELGYLPAVTSAIASLGEAARIDWEYATVIREDFALVQSLSANLGLNTDAIFTLAISLI